MTHFEGIVPALAHALEKRGYTDLTPVQLAMLAPDLAEADALVSAQTGSGKTVAFGLALAPTLLAGADRFGYVPAPLALVVAPTRELALQVQRELTWLYEETGANIASCVGGMDYRTERRALERGAHIVVGTPGRLRDHIERHSLDLSGLRAAVLDEADEMLDLGFREDLEFILDAAPADRRTLMFSATVSKPIATLAQSYQRGAVRIAAGATRKQHVDIDYRALSVAAPDRENAIINLLRFYEAQTALVFCSTRAAVNHLMARFNNRGFSVVALSGELSQNERTHALQAMRDGRARVCIATDVAARGIDLPGLELVIHADLPGNGETLLHRSGRTGRAGNKGVSALIVTPGDRKKAERLLASASINATWAKPPSADDVNARDVERLLESPTLAAGVAEDEADLVGRILATHAPDRVAAAFVRLWRSGRSAPEELRDAGEPVRRERAEFGDSVWLALSVGRSQSAEPRWLLPMICGAGGITKNEIGAIRMQEDETHVQLAAHAVKGFLAAVGTEMMLEKGIKLRVMDQPPETLRSAPPASKPQYRKSYDDVAPARAPSVRPEAKAEPRPVAAQVPVAVLAEPAVVRSTVAEAPTERSSPRPRPEGAPAKRPYVRKPRFDDEVDTDAIVQTHASETAAEAPRKARWKDEERPQRPAKVPFDPDRGGAVSTFRPRDAEPPAKRPYAAKSAAPKPARDWKDAGRPGQEAAGADRSFKDKPFREKPFADRTTADKPRAEARAPAEKSPYRAAEAAAPKRRAATAADGAPARPKGFDPTDPGASRRKPGTKPAYAPAGKGPRKVGPKAVGKVFARPGTDAPKRPKPKG